MKIEGGNKKMTNINSEEGKKLFSDALKENNIIQEAIGLLMFKYEITQEEAVELYEGVLSLFSKEELAALVCKHLATLFITAEDFKTDLEADLKTKELMDNA